MSRIVRRLVSPHASNAASGTCPFKQSSFGANHNKHSTNYSAVYADYNGDSHGEIVSADSLTRCSNEIPGPKGLPFVGTLFAYIKKNGFRFNKLFEAHVHRFNQYGPFFREKIVGRTFNVLRDLREWRTKVIQEEPKCPRRVVLEPMVRYRKMRNLSQGLVNSQGEEWFKFRSTFDKKLLAPKEIECHFEPLSAVADDFIAHLQHLADTQTNTVYNIEKEVFKWSLESICAVLFSSRLGCFQSPPSEKSEYFITNCRKFFTNLQQLMYEPPYKKWMSSKTWDDFVECSDNLLRQGMEMVESVPKDSLAGYFLLNSHLRKDEVALTVIDLIIGAMETTTKTTIWNLYCLAKWQAAQERIHKEIVDSVGARRLKLDDLRDLPLVKASLKETLRLYPAPFVISRILQNDTNVRGYRVPAGEEVVISLWAVGHDESVFPDHLNFIPERWVQKDLTPSQKMYCSLPFGHGRRMCIGRRIAEMKIYILLSKLIGKCKLECANEEPVQPIIEMTLAQDRPVHLRLQKRIPEFNAALLSHTRQSNTDFSRNICPFGTQTGSSTAVCI
ncbi:cytochrome P450 10-like [Paramacrobiotus metropolitanus]|uniref:cytochrome P450 10-like n=1 Tax=Paramacrobiotus metropolitanus TaxID=2943436 RepID=UPI0024455F4B|nr:cytochrome P450 10-like [Paramacrobiotus metropolitanus]